MRRQLSSPFERTRRKLVVHCTYHKMGTKWLTRVLFASANRYGLSFQAINDNPQDLDLRNDVVFFNHSDLVAQELECVGSHMVRDLRDVVVSGYFYHLWTKEHWAHVPRPEYGNCTYQEHLNRLSEEDGIHAEIDRFASYVDGRGLRKWNYNDPRFLEIKYEDIFGREESGFRRIFEHYGFHSQALDACVEIAVSFSFKNMVARDQSQSRKRSHLRSGRSGQWQDVFNDRHKQHFKERLGDVLMLLKYEHDLNW